MKILIHDVANERRVAVIELEVMPDHVLLLCEVDPQFGIHKFIKQVKGRSFARVASRIPVAEESIAEFVDEFLLCFHRRRCTACRY